MDIVRKQTGENTRAVHLPAPPTPSQQPLGTPVFRTASFSFGTAEDATTCAPARAKVQNTPLTAAIPEANAWAAGHRGRFTPSSAATARANASTVGLSIRL